LFLIVFATTAVLTFSSLVALTPAALAPEIATALGLPASVVGFQISLVYAGAMVTSLIGGALTQRIGASRGSQVALILLGGGAALAAFPAAITIALASLLIGFGYGMTNPGASHLLVRFTPSERRGLIFSIKQTGVPLGGVLAGACAPALALLVGWQWALMALALMALVGAALLQLKRAAWDDDRDPKARLIGSPFAGVGLVWANRPLRYLSLVGMCFSCVQLCLSAFTVTLLVEDLSLGLVQAGLIMSAVQVSGVAGRVCWGWTADRIGSGTATLVLAGAMTTAGTLATALMTSAWPVPAVTGVLILFGFSALGWNGVYLAEVARLAPAGEVARASGGSLFFTFSGVLLGPTAFAGLHALIESYTLSFAALAAVAGAGVGFVVLAKRVGAQPAVTTTS
jgi:MFS family permease